MEKRNERGVRYEYSHMYAEEIFYLDRGSFRRKKQFGIWALDLMAHSPGEEEEGECGCNGRRLPHVLYACPRCGGISASYVSKYVLARRCRESLMCNRCGQHLWIVFEGFNSAEWDVLMQKKKDRPK